MKSLKWLLLLFLAQSLLVVCWIFLTRSESGAAVFLWLSAKRLALLGAASIVSAGTAGIVIAAWKSPSAIESARTKLDAYCLDKKHLGPLLVILSIGPLLVLVALVCVAIAPTDYASYRSWAPDTFPLLHSFVLAVLPLVVLGGLVAFEATIWLAAHYRASLVDQVLSSWSKIAAALIALAICLSTIFYWMVLAFQLRFFANNPAWYWKFAPIPFTKGDLAFAIISLLLLVLIYWVLFVRRRVLIGLLLVFLLGWFLQLGVGLMSGLGLDGFRDRYFGTYHKTYIAKASASSVSLLVTVQQYEQLYGNRFFTNTKPPGLMVFYTAIDHVISGFPSRYSGVVRFERFGSLVTSAFPAVAMLLVFGVFWFGRRKVFTQVGPGPGIAALLAVLCPNFVLFSLFPDQALYPPLFLLGTALVVAWVRRQSFPLAFFLGAFLYLAAFFAFTMLPLYPMAVLFIALDYWFNRGERRLARQIGIALTMAAGSVFLYLVFRAALNYDFLPRFAKTVEINHNFDFYLRVGRQPPFAAESLPTRLLQILQAACLNNVDFAAALGFPIYLLFLVQSVHLLIRLLTGSTRSPGDLVLGALLLSFIVLNLAGTAQGEVPRLWLFWLPMIVILAARELEPLVQRHPRVLLYLGIAQLATYFLTFHFQDLRM